MLTAKDGEYDEAEALDTGADDYLAKPFSYVVLLARLRALVRRGGRERPVALTVGRPGRRPGRAALPPGRGRDRADAEGVRRAGRRSRGGPARWCPRPSCSAGVWDFAYDGDPNIVEVYISALRRKIDAPFGRHDPGDGARRRLPAGARMTLAASGRARHAAEA